jgi:hypothetical protein
MAEVRLTAEEAEVLREVLGTLAVRGRTGEVGVVHGADRFVSTQHVLRKPARSALDTALDPSDPMANVDRPCVAVLHAIRLPSGEIAYVPLAGASSTRAAPPERGTE